MGYFTAVPLFGGRGIRTGWPVKYGTVISARWVSNWSRRKHITENRLQHYRCRFWGIGDLPMPSNGRMEVRYYTAAGMFTPSVLTLTVKAFAGNSQSIDTALNLFSPPRSAVMVTGPRWECKGRVVADARMLGRHAEPFRGDAFWGHCRSAKVHLDRMFKLHDLRELQNLPIE